VSRTDRKFPIGLVIQSSDITSLWYILRYTLTTILHKISFTIAATLQYQQIFNNAVNFIEEWDNSNYRAA
jgi:hypothetical protein